MPRAGRCRSVTRRRHRRCMWSSPRTGSCRGMASSRQWHAHPPTSSQVSAERTPLDDFPRWVALLSITARPLPDVLSHRGAFSHRCLPLCRRVQRDAVRGALRQPHGLLHPEPRGDPRLGAWDGLVCCQLRRHRAGEKHTPSFVARRDALDRFGANGPRPESNCCVGPTD